jgi:hypothetical protein
MFKLLVSILNPVSSLTDSRSTSPPVFGYVNTFNTHVNPKPPALALLFDNLDRSRAFLLEYLNPDLLFLFKFSVERTDSSPSFICSCFNYVLQSLQRNKLKSLEPIEI